MYNFLYLEINQDQITKKSNHKNNEISEDLKGGIKLTPPPPQLKLALISPVRIGVKDIGPLGLVS